VLASPLASCLLTKHTSDDVSYTCPTIWPIDRRHLQWAWTIKFQGNVSTLKMSLTASLQDRHYYLGLKWITTKLTHAYTNRCDLQQPWTTCKIFSSYAHKSIVVFWKSLFINVQEKKRTDDIKNATENINAIKYEQKQTRYHTVGYLHWQEVLTAMIKVQTTKLAHII